METKQTIEGRRTIRKYQQKEIPREVLKELVNAARLAPSAANMQPLEYVVVDEEPFKDGLFKTLKWAGYIKDGTPESDERPVAYIVILIRKERKTTYSGHDSGAAAENIMLLAHDKGIGSCWIGSVDRERAREILAVPEDCIIDTVVALGYRGEESEVYDSDETVKYERENGKYHVPKRPLEKIIHWNNG